MPFRLPLLLLTLTTAIGLAACGGGDSDEDEIRTALETVATSTDPAEVCDTYVTDDFLRQIQGEDDAAAARESCREDAADPGAEEVQVANVEVDGERATAELMAQGGDLDGQTIEIALVNEGDEWKLDEVVRYVDFDREAQLRSIAEDLREDEEVPPAGAECIIAGLRGFSDEELQAPIIEGDISGYVDLFAGCAQRGT